MNRRRKFWLPLCLILLGGMGFAQSDEDKRGLAIEHVGQLFDIRAYGAPAFRLRTSFKIIEDNSTTEGTYTEIWVSGKQWRRETVLGNFRRIEVSNDGKHSTLDSASNVPAGIGDVVFRLDLPRVPAEFWKSVRAEKREIDSVPVRCFGNKSRTSGDRWAFCLDSSTGQLVAKDFPIGLSTRAINGTCTYKDYQKFAEKWFPQVIRCFVGPNLVLEEQVVELSLEPSPDLALFAPLTGGRTSEDCKEVTSPKGVYTPDPDLPEPASAENPVVLQLTIGADGKVRDLKVVRSAGKPYDNAATETVRLWRFVPAMRCGEPVVVQTNVEVTFTMFR